MDLFDLLDAKPGMHFMITFKPDAELRSCHRFLWEVFQSEQISFTLVDQGVEIERSATNTNHDSPLNVVLITLQPSFTPKLFLRKLSHQVQRICSIIWHGSYLAESHFLLKQHRYASTDCEDEVQGYVEVLEIADPPKDQHPFALYTMYGGKRDFYTFLELSAAVDAFEEILQNGFPSTPTQAFKEHLSIDKDFPAKPWFFATEKDRVKNGLAFPLKSS